ncbi:MAG: hypothetical protein OEO21_02665 [Candidatus Krumholzibacteria bacterium]|nr:hypothetical protein [Candidatus Krumholzibacteria bacterium]
MSHFGSSMWSRGVAGLVTIALLVVQLGAGAIPCAAGSPADDLKQIQYKHYFRGKYTEAIAALEKYLTRKDLSAQDARNAREFLAASHVLSGASERGSEIFLQLLIEAPDYTGPDPTVFREEVVVAYRDARDAYAESRIKAAPKTEQDEQAAPALASTEGGKPIYKQWWLYAGIATALLVAGALAAEKGDDPAPRDTGTVSVGVTVR